MSQSWNIIVCGDFPNPVIVSVPDPSKWRVTELKQEISKQAGGIPTTDITLYLGNTVIPEDKPLKECQGIKNGIALLASIKPFVINVYCPDNDVTLVIKVPKREFDSWTIEMIQRVIGFKRLLTVRGEDRLVFAGNALTDKYMHLSRIPGITSITSNCLMTYTRLESYKFLVPNIEKSKFPPVLTVLLPHRTDLNFASIRSFCGRYLDTSTLGCNHWFKNCRITVQQLDGSKTSVALYDPRDLSIRLLREAISEATSVPTHQQRLMLGDTVLEDWKKSSNSSYSKYEKAMITDYPSFCDGVTLHLVQLTGGICVNFKPQYARSHDNYLNILNPSVTTLQNTFQHMKALLHTSENQKVYLLGTSKSFSPSDDLVSSIEWITDGCELTFNAPN